MSVQTELVARIRLELEDRESVAHKIAKYNLLAGPVLERDGSVVGFVTVDDVVDVLIEEQTEDMYQMAGRSQDRPGAPGVRVLYGTPSHRLKRQQARDDIERIHKEFIRWFEHHPYRLIREPNPDESEEAICSVIEPQRQVDRFDMSCSDCAGTCSAECGREFMQPNARSDTVKTGDPDALARGRVLGPDPRRRVVRHSG
jgi:hypothetical protein